MKRIQIRISIGSKIGRMIELKISIRISKCTPLISAINAADQWYAFCPHSNGA